MAAVVFTIGIKIASDYPMQRRQSLCAGKPPLLYGNGGFREREKKKRGRKEDFFNTNKIQRLKGAAHGFRNLSVIKISLPFEWSVTQMKTKSDEIVNKPE